MTPASFSKANRSLILTVDMVYALATTIESDRAMPIKTRRCIERITHRIKTIQTILFGGDTLILAEKEYRQYSRIVHSIKTLIQNIAGDVVELDFFNAVLVLVEDARCGCKRSSDKRLQREWEFLNQSLVTLYAHVDPDLSQGKMMMLGESLAERFRRIMVGE